MQRRALYVSVFLVLLACLIFAGSVLKSQTALTPSGVTVAELQSADPLRRANAFWKLKDNPKLLEPTKTAVILLDLLERENRLFDSALVESKERVGAGDKYGEGWAEYYKELLETVERTANKKDPRVVEIIAGSTFSPGWDAAIGLAKRYPDRILPVIFEIS